MKTKDETMVAFYQKIGLVFYAIAAADKTVKQQEIDTLKAIVNRRWLNLEDAEDEYGTDAAFQIESAFEYLLDSDSKATYALDHLEEFMKLHSHVFNDYIKHLIYKTAEDIADSFYGLNKAESEILNKLDRLLFG